MNYWIYRCEGRGLVMQYLHEYGNNTCAAWSYRSPDSAFSTKCAACNATLSRAKRPTTCTPSGNPSLSANPGTLMQGGPSRVHSRLKVGTPVDPRPRGAAPGADGVR